MKTVLCLFHNVRNLDVKLQLGHPLPLKTLDLTMNSINSYWVGKIHQHQICIGFPRWWSIIWTMYTAECGPAKFWKSISWINVVSRQWQGLALCPHSDLVCHSPSDWNKISPTRIIVDDTKIPFQKPKHQVAQWSTYSTYKTETQ
jgi:hypothetical protein